MRRKPHESAPLSQEGLAWPLQRRLRLLKPPRVRHTGSGTRGRVVMLVDNAVIGDSRVQKQAGSMADRGWDVVLLGRRRHEQRDRVPARWRIGEARVQLLPFQGTMSRRRHQDRRSWLRSPLAYPTLRFAKNRHTEVIARISYGRFRSASRAGGSGPIAYVRHQAARVRLLWVRTVLVRWVEWRFERTQRLHDRHRHMDGWLDRVSTAFWQRLLGDDAWRALDPELLEFEAVYGPVLDRMRPDIIHANDFRMLGVGARAVTRARAEGREVKLVWDAHEFLPGIRPWSDHPRWHRAQILHERVYAPYADTVVTVTQPLAELLVQEHGLDREPTVVLNAPMTERAHDAEQVIGIRERCGLPEGVPLLVYSGAAAPQRGLDVMVDGLVAMPGTHVAFVVSDPPNRYVEGLVDRATALGVQDRLHVLPYVPVEDIVPFLDSATIGVIPAHKNVNHHISLGTKFFEYSHAGLPILVSDLRAMAAMVTATGQGEVFTAEDAADYARVATKMLENLDHYRSAYTPEVLRTWTWEHQAEVLDGVYTSLLADRPDA